GRPARGPAAVARDAGPGRCGGPRAVLAGASRDLPRAALRQRHLGPPAAERAAEQPAPALGRLVGGGLVVGARDRAGRRARHPPDRSAAARPSIAGAVRRAAVRGAGVSWRDLLGAVATGLGQDAATPAEPAGRAASVLERQRARQRDLRRPALAVVAQKRRIFGGAPDRKSTRLNSSHVKISYA